MPESLFQPNDIDVRRLTIESPEHAKRELPFDAERDMPEHYWTALTEAIENCNLEQGRTVAFRTLIENLAVLRTIAPKRFDVAAIRDKVAALSKSEAKRSLRLTAHESWLSTLFHLKIVYPSELAITSDANWEDLKGMLDHLPGDVVSHYGKLRLIAPEYAEELEGEARRAWRDNLTDLIDLEHIPYRVREKAELRLCDDLLRPELVTSQDEWQQYLDYFQSMANQLTSMDAAHYTEALQILTPGLFHLRLLEAPAITMTEEGLLLDFDQSGLTQPSDPPNLPEQRRY